jgi:hypothetical protein
MTIKSSGPLSMTEINSEFGRGTNLGSYRGTPWYTDNGGSGFFSSGALPYSEFYNKKLAPVIISADYLIVGGGAAGAHGSTNIGDGGGGGGAGGMLEGSVSLSLLSGSIYPVVVGAGGIKWDGSGIFAGDQLPGESNFVARVKSWNGRNSSFYNFVALGGGTGGTYFSSQGYPGGSGGGSLNFYDGGAGTPGQGYAGGSGPGYMAGAGGGGGGGGAGGPGLKGNG